MKCFLLILLLICFTYSVKSYPQLGLGMNEQRQQQRLNQMGGGLGLNLGLGLNSGTFSRSNQMEGMNRMMLKRSIETPRKCFLQTVRVPVASTTTQATSSQGVDPRGEESERK